MPDVQRVSEDETPAEKRMHDRFGLWCAALVVALVVLALLQAVTRG